MKIGDKQRTMLAQYRMLSATLGVCVCVWVCGCVCVCVCDASKAGHFGKFCSRVLEINFGRDSRVSKIAFTEKILHTLHDFQ